MRLGLLIAIIIAAAALASGCIRVNHLGDRTAKSYDNVFAQQRRTAGAQERPKAMEAELGAEATRKLVAGAQAAAPPSAVGVAGNPVQ